MKENYDLRFHVGVLGFSKSNKNIETIKAIGAILHEIRLRVSDQFNTESKTAHQNVIIDLFVDLSLSDQGLLQNFNDENITVNWFTTGTKGDNPMLQSSGSVTELNGICNAFNDVNNAISWIEMQSDIIIAFKDNDKSSQNSMIWNVLCGRANNTLTICIDANEPGKVYFIDRYSSIPFSSKVLKEYIDALYIAESPQETLLRKPFLFSGLWEKVYNRYMNKYKAHAKQIPYVEDFALNENYINDDTDTKRKINHQKLVAQFNFYDERSNEISKKYRESIYFRSILPFISTVFLAVGFYVETVLGILPYAFGITANFFMVVAGVGFLLHAMINVYAYLMSKDRGVEDSQSEFLKNRYIAEFLRVIVHFQPFGIPVSYDCVKDNAFKTEVRRILRMLAPYDYSFCKSDAKKIVDHSILMLSDQITYHTNTKARLELVVKGLKTFYGRIFWIGFGFVVLRGLLQFAMPFLSSFLQFEINNGIKWVSYIRSFSNMLALFLPAWAVYFSSKLALNNFDGLYRHSDIAVKNLVLLKNKAESLLNDENISYEVLVAFSEDIVATQIGEVNDWLAQTASKTVTRL